MRRRPSLIVPVLVAVLLAGCAGSGTDRPQQPADAGGALPGGDHVHALRVADDGALLLGLHGALWRSPEGREWEELGLRGQDAMAIGVAQEGEPLLVGGHDVLVRSTDGGETFEELRPDDLPHLDIHALAQAPSDPSVVYAAVVGAGVFRSGDAGATWERTAAFGEELPPDLGAMAVDPGDPDAVVVGSGSRGVLRSSDGARSFTRTSEWGVVGLAFGDEGRMAAVTYRGVDRSEDGGRTWQNVASVDDLVGDPRAIAISDAGAVWVLTEGPRALLRSDDDGVTFAVVARA